MCHIKIQERLIIQNVGQYFDEQCAFHAPAMHDKIESQMQHTHQADVE